MIPLEDMMTTDVTTLTPDASVLDARRLMTTKGIRHIPIVNKKGKLAGLFSQRDLLAVTDSTELDIPKAQREENESKIRLGEVMTTRVSTASPNVALRDAAVFLQNNKYGCLPVVENGEVRGIITDTDFIGVAINLLEQIELEEPTEFEDSILEEEFA